MTENGADRKRISRKPLAGRGFSQDSLPEINLEPCPSLSRHAVIIPHFPQWTRNLRIRECYATSTFSSRRHLSFSSEPDSSNELVMAALPFSTLVMT